MAAESPSDTWLEGRSGGLSGALPDEVPDEVPDELLGVAVLFWVALFWGDWGRSPTAPATLPTFFGSETCWIMIRTRTSSTMSEIRRFGPALLWRAD